MVTPCKRRGDVARQHRRVATCHHHIHIILFHPVAQGFFKLLNLLHFVYQHIVAASRNYSPLYPFRQFPESSKVCILRILHIYVNDIALNCQFCSQQFQDATLSCTPVTGQNHSLSFSQITINLSKVVATFYSLHN